MMSSKKVVKRSWLQNHVSANNLRSTNKLCCEHLSALSCMERPELPFKCSCGQGFLLQGGLTTHRRTCSGSLKQMAGVVRNVQSLFKQRKKRRLDALSAGTAGDPITRDVTSETGMGGGVLAGDDDHGGPELIPLQHSILPQASHVDAHILVLLLSHFRYQFSHVLPSLSTLLSTWTPTFLTQRIAPSPLLKDAKDGKSISQLI